MSLETHFRKFTAGPTTSKQKAVHVTLRPDGVIYLNQNAYRMMGRPGAVALYYSDETDTIAIDPADPRSGENFPVMPKGKTGWEINAGNFCSHHALRPKQTQQFVRPHIDADGTLRLNMRDKVNSTPRPHRKRRS